MSIVQQQQPSSRGGAGGAPPAGAAQWISSSPFPTRPGDRDPQDNDELSERLRQTWTFSPGPSTPSPSSSSNQASPSSTTRAANANANTGGMDAFLQTHSRVVKVLGLPLGTTQDDLIRWIIRDRRVGAGGVRGVFGDTRTTTTIGEPAGWWVLFDSHEDARNSLRLSSSYYGDCQVTVSPALEQDLVSDAKMVDVFGQGAAHNYHTPPLTPSHPPHTRSSSVTSIGTSMSGSPLAARSQIWGLSPLNPQQTQLQQPAQHQQEQEQWSAASGYGGMLGLGLGLSVGVGQGLDALTGLGLGTGSVSFRSGDWICPADNCNFHNFSRNDRCGQCGVLKPTGSTGSHPRHSRTPSVSPTRTFNPLPPTGSYASIHAPALHRNISGPLAPPSHMQQQRGLTTSASNPNFFGAERGLPFPSGQAVSPGGSGALGLTGVGGDANSSARARSISYTGGGMRGMGMGRGGHPPGMVPILNTGNQGVMVVQPGDWACGDCGFVNWRRRTCCLRCYPNASGNESNGLSLAQSAQIAAQLAAMPSFTPNAAQHSPQSPAASIGSAPGLNRSNSTSSASNATGAISSTSSPAPVGTGRPTFLSSGPYRPSVQSPETNNHHQSPVQTDVFGHVVPINNNAAGQQPTRQRTATMPAINGSAW